MSPAARKPTWDVLIVAAAKGRSGCGHRLRAELDRLGLRVKLDLVPVPSVPDLPQDVVADAKRAAVLVAMIAVRERVGGELRESVGYLLASAPSILEGRSAPGTPGTGPAGHDVETGLIDRDMAALVERVAARVRLR